MSRSNADIMVDGIEFDIERIGRESTDRWFELNISVEESTRGTPNHEFRKILQPGGRSNLTNELIENALQSWSEAHPEYTISEFGLSEGCVARIGRRNDDV